MTRFFAWPAALPASLAGLHEQVAAAVGDGAPAVLDRIADLAAARRQHPGPAALLLVPATETDPGAVAELLAGLAALADEPDLAVVAVVGDGWLGTDGPGLVAAGGGGAVVAVLRSIAVRRGGTVRANVVCAPEGLVGVAGSQRGPMRHEVGSRDVADAAAFLLGPDAPYLAGQVLFVDGGRHLFSSLTA